MKRSPMKRSGGLARSAPMKRGTKSIAARSAKMKAKYSGSGATEGRAAFVARILASRVICEVCDRVARAVAIGKAIGAPALPGRWRHCGNAPVDVHEILRRSAGGDILDEANVLTTCRDAHVWLHAHPKHARELGLLRSRYDQPPTPTTSTTAPAEVPE